MTGYVNSSDWRAICRDVDVPAMWFDVRRSTIQHKPWSFLHVWTARCTVLCHVRHQTGIQCSFRYHHSLERHRTVTICLFYNIIAWKSMIFRYIMHIILLVVFATNLVHCRTTDTQRVCAFYDCSQTTLFSVLSPFLLTFAASLVK